MAIKYNKLIQTGEAKSQTDLAQKLGVSRVHVNHYMRLLDLDVEVIRILEDLGDPLTKRIITERKLRLLINLPADEQKMAVKSLIPSQETHLKCPK